MQLARTSSELSPTVARHEKGVSFWEVESIAKGWKTLRTAVYNSTVSEIEPVHPSPSPSVFICSTSRPPRFSKSFSRNNISSWLIVNTTITAPRCFHVVDHTAENRFSSNRFILHFSARELDHRRFKCTPFELQFSIAQFQLLSSRRLFITMRYIFVIYLKEKFNNISPHRLNSIIFL